MPPVPPRAVTADLADKMLAAAISKSDASDCE